MLLLITPYGAPANWTQRKASVVVSITDEDCDLRDSGGMNRNLPTGGSAYGMPFHETTLFHIVSILRSGIGIPGELRTFRHSEEHLDMIPLSPSRRQCLWSSHWPDLCVWRKQKQQLRC
jgi:hypothetical protein